MTDLREENKGENEDVRERKTNEEEKESALRLAQETRSKHHVTGITLLQNLQLEKQKMYAIILKEKQ